MQRARTENIGDKLDRIAQRRGVTKKEALEQIVVEDSVELEKAEARFREIENAKKS